MAAEQPAADQRDALACGALMSLATHRANVTAVVELINRRAQTGERMIVAIAGPPASGKTTLAGAVVERLNAAGSSTEPRRAAVLPMDGFHLDNETLQARGLLARKGAVETFDAAGFCAAIRTIVEEGGAQHLPGFNRDEDRVIPDQIRIAQETQVIVTEGNYLLLDQSPWRELHPMFAASVFVKAPIEVLRVRLLERWLDQNLSQQEAQERVTNNDLPNARHVLSRSVDADLFVEHEVHDDLVDVG